jgi:hypothetical protein
VVLRYHPQVLADAWQVWERMGFPPIMDNFIEKVYHRNRTDEAALLDWGRIIDYMKDRQS